MVTCGGYHWIHGNGQWIHVVVLTNFLFLLGLICCFLKNICHCNMTMFHTLHLLSLPTVPSYCSFPKRFSDENNCFLLRSANFTALNATWQITVAAAHGTGTYISIKTNFNDYQDNYLQLQSYSTYRYSNHINYSIVVIVFFVDVNILTVFFYCIYLFNIDNHRKWLYPIF